MDKLKTTNNGGFPMVLDDFRWMLSRLTAPNEGIYAALNNMLRGYGENFIVQGCVIGGSTGAFTLTEGWILLAGELIKVDAQAAFNEATDSTFVRATTYDSRGNKTFRNATTDDTYEINRASISGALGTLAYDGVRFAEMKVAATLSSAGADSTVVVKTKIIQIGDWNMDATISVVIAHGITDFSKIRSMNASIISDSGSVIQPLDKYNSGTFPDGGVVYWDATNVGLSRVTGAFFDSTAYDSTSFNRGHINVEYEV